MTDKDKKKNSDQIPPPVVLPPSDEFVFSEEFDESKAMPLSELKEDLGINVPLRKSEDMIGEQFYILSGKPFPSSFDQEYNPFFCRCIDYTTKDEFGLVVGGQQPVEQIQSLMDAGANVPILVTLNYHEGKGEHSGYYTLD